MKDKMRRGMPDTENVGIMQGFMDAFDDDLEEGEDEEGAETMLERRPDSPEILMNNLRGDMRSIDARREELADLVGYAAAAETPEPVLAMLQPVLAQQGGGGIGGLPQSQPMAQGPQPPMAMPPGAPPGMPPGMPPGPPPADQGGIAALMGGAPPGPPPGPPGGGMPAPVGMAKGGLVVQRFQAGSDEDGVTPAEDETPSAAASGRFFDPAVQAAIRQRIQDTLAAQPQAVPDVKALYEQKLPAYRALLGDTRDLTQAQMLFDLAQRGFGFAANVDARGRPLQGSFVSRLAGAVQDLPGVIGARLGELEKGERAVKSAALSSAEKEVENIKRMNQQLEARREKLVGQLSGQAVKESADERRERLSREGIEARAQLETVRQEGANLRSGLAITSRERMQQESLAASAQRQVEDIQARLQNTQLGIDARKLLQDQLLAARKQAADADRTSRELIAAERNATTRLNAIDKNATMLQIAAERSQAAMTPGFGRGITGTTLNIFTSLAPGFGAGTLSEEQDRVFETAVANYLTANRRVGTDALGNSYEQYPTLPQYMVTALRARGKTELIPPSQQAARPAGTPPPVAGEGAPAGGGTPAPAAPAPAAPATPPGPPRPPLDSRPISLTPEERPYTFFNLAEKGTGIIPVTSSFVAKFPLLGDLAPGEQQATSFLRAGVNQLARSLAVGDRFTEGERRQITGDLELLPQLIDNTESYRNRLMGLDALLQSVENRAKRTYEDATVARPVLQKAAQDYNEARQVRALLGIADLPRFNRTREDSSRVNALPPGSWFVFNSVSGPILIQKPLR
jgi:hypothetical protein